MAEQKTFNLGLTIVALVALVSIVSLVALVLFSAKSPSFATGGQLVEAQDALIEQNIAGQVNYKTIGESCEQGSSRTYKTWTNGAASESYCFCTGTVSGERVRC